MTSRLLYVGDPVVYGFEHAMDHRLWIGLRGDDRSGYSIIPYWIGQRYGDELHDVPEWRLNHQVAHWDALYPPADPMGPFSAPVGQVLWMSGPSDPTAKWWEFANHQEHYLAAQNIAENQFTLYYPFW